MEISRKNAPNLCRVCLTPSKNLAPLTSSPHTKIEQFIPETTIQDMLEYATSNKVIMDKALPSKICPICLSYLKIAVEFKIQFMQSQQKIKEATKKASVDVLEGLQGLFEVPVPRPQPCPPPAPVELIYGGSKFDLKDVFVVEDNEPPRGPKDVFRGFLNNLGTEISAQFVSQGRPVAKPPEEEPQVICELPLITKTLHECHRCKACFELEADLIDHCKDCFKRSSTYVCDKCGHLSHSDSAFRHHLVKHQGKIHKCDLCPKRYETTSRLKSHKEVHKNLRNHLCNVCGKSFNYSISLRYHMHMHSDVKEHVCSVCGFAFKMAHTLKAHMRRHADVKPHNCEFCGRGFATTGEFKEHQRVHTGEMPFGCEYCGKSFAKKWTRDMHYMQHAGSFECSMCEKTFVEDRFLMMHYRRVHKLVVRGEEG